MLQKGDDLVAGVPGCVPFFFEPDRRWYGLCIELNKPTGFIRPYDYFSVVLFAAVE